MNNPSQSLDPIQMLWVRGPLSRLELLSVRSFLANGHPVHLYTYDAPANAPQGVEIRDASAVVPAHLAPLKPAAPFALGSMGAFSDYFRYHLLWNLGGWWADMDMVCLRPWRFSESSLVASSEEDGYGLKANTYVLKFPAGHPVIGACLADVTSRDPSQIGFGQSGPLLLSRVLHEQNALSLMQPPERFGPVPWNASHQLVRSLWSRFSIDELKQRIRRPHLSMRVTADTVGIHLWNETWRHAGRDKNGVYPHSCLYERLQRRFNPSGQ